MIDAIDSALNQAPESLDAVGVDVTANINAVAVLDSEVAIPRWLSVLVEHGADTGVSAEFVSVDHAARNNVLANQSEKA